MLLGVIIFDEVFNRVRPGPSEDTGQLVVAASPPTARASDKTVKIVMFPLDSQERHPVRE